LTPVEEKALLADNEQYRVDLMAFMEYINDPSVEIDGK
jgi:hypothetical protein